MIIIRTNHDTQTNYLYLWSNSLVYEAKRKGFKVTKIEGKNITFEELKGKIKSVKPKFIFFNGHGSTDCWFNNEKQDFLCADSSYVLKGTVTFARACNCVKDLGKSSVDNDCKAFIGYKRKFWIARQHKYECQPLKDKVAKPVMESSNVIVKELLKGKTAKEAVHRSHEVSADWILKLIYSKEPLAAASLYAVRTNDITLHLEGDGSAKIC